MEIIGIWSALAGVVLNLFLYWICVGFLGIELHKSSARFFLIGLAGGVMGVVCWHQQKQIWAVVTLLFFFALQMLVVVIDMDTMEIPDQLVLVLLLVGVVSLVTMPEMNILERVEGAFVVSLPLLLITLMIPDAFGGGDIKLMAVCGFFLGWKLTLIALSIAIFTGGSYGIWLLITRQKGRKDHFAFGPFLSLSMTCAWFFGKGLLSWYLGLFWI